jgi:hypothetical protein
MRIVVTGSREVTDLAAVKAALIEAAAGPRGPHTVVHGAARGADSLAAIAATRLGWNVEAHPADWSGPCRDECRPDCRRTRSDGSDYCSAAGRYRNQHMVDLGAQVVVAIYKRGAQNKGTADCVKRAGRAGLTIKRVTT